MPVIAILSPGFIRRIFLTLPYRKITGRDGQVYAQPDDRPAFKAPFWKSNSFYGSAIFALGFLLSWLPLAVLLPPLIAVPDEVFQGLEAGHRLAFGYGLVPWEFDYGARSWALGVLSALPMSLAGLLGQGPDVYLPMTWGFFSLGSAAMILCAGLWGKRCYGRWGGLVTALIAAAWLDNLYYGGRTYSEVLGAHLLIVAVFLAEPGYRVENRNRLIAAGFVAALASLLRMQLGPVALLLWLWHWRDRKRLLLLSLGAAAALVVDGSFDALTGWYPFQPIWQNIRFNLVLDGAASFGTAPWWKYFGYFWDSWGALTVPFAALALLGARRLPILAAMALLTLAIHMGIPHKEYRFILPAVMMASILAGLGTMEAARWLTRMFRGVLGDMAGFAAGALMALLWLVMGGANLAAMLNDPPWQQDNSLLQLSLELAHQPSLCGLGITAANAYATGGYAFLHQPVPIYYAFDPKDIPAFAAKARAYNMLIVSRSNLEYLATIPQLARYSLDHCTENQCLLVRPGRCVSPSVSEPPRAPLAPLRATVTFDGDYPYASGIAPREEAASSPLLSFLQVHPARAHQTR